MKKILLTVMAVAAIGFTSCGNKTQQAEATDSTVVTTDAEEKANAVIDNLKAFVAAGDAEQLAACLGQAKEMVGEFALNNPDAAKTIVTTVQNYLKENAEQVKAIVEKNAAAASAFTVFMETEPEALVSNIAESLSNKAEATKNTAATAAEATKDVAAEAVNKTVENTKAAVNQKVEDAKAAANQKAEESKAAAKQKAEETKATAKQKANEAVDNAAQNVKKGLGL
jgi:hypothetical protein